MMVISHNISAINAQRQFNINNKAKSAQRLSSGYKINRAADDAAGLSISEKKQKYDINIKIDYAIITEATKWEYDLIEILIVCT